MRSKLQKMAYYFSCWFETEFFFAESCEEGATSDYYIKKKLKGRIEGALLSKTKDTLTLATFFENTNQLKA